MKVLLVNPKLEHGHQYYPPMGIAYLAAVLEQQGIPVEILDCNFEDSFESIKVRISSVNPDIVGITATTPQISNAYRIAEIAKQASDATVVLGGSHPTVATDKVVRHPSVDVVVRGEGELTMSDLASKIAHEEDLKDVAGIAYRKNGDVTTTGTRQSIGDLDCLPFPARHLLPTKKYLERVPMLTMITSRGCPFGCIFCAKEIFGKHYRARSPENIIEELEQIVQRYSMSHIWFVDDVFTLDRKRTMDLCEKLRSSKLDVVWQCETRVDLVDRELLNAMKRAGCIRIDYGVESGSEFILKVLNKGFTLDQIRRAFQLTREIGVETGAFIIFGTPGEDLKMIQDTVESVKELNPDHVDISILTPLPGTKLFSIVGDRLLIQDWGELDYKHKLIFRHGKVSKDQMEKAVKKAYIEIYLHRYGSRFVLSSLRNYRRIMPRAYYGLLYGLQRLRTYLRV